MGKPLNIVAVQVAPLSFTGSAARFAEDVADVVRRHPDAEMIIYPELHLFSTKTHVQSGEYRGAVLDSVSMDGDFVRELAQIARVHGIWLIPGSINEKASHGELYNTTIVFNPQGEIVASYRKMFPWRPFEPHTPGTSFVLFDIDGVGRIGLNTCYDIWFPETCRNLTWMGADLIINLVKTGTPDRDQEIVLVRATAIVNQVVVLSVNSAQPAGRGSSLIVGPEGEVLSEAMHDRPAELTYVFDVNQIERVREVGTMSTNKMWKQFRPGDQPVPLPMYQGSIDPSRWSPDRRTPNN